MVILYCTPIYAWNGTGMWGRAGDAGYFARDDVIMLFEYVNKEDR
jgi:hypothetical protein